MNNRLVIVHGWADKADRGWFKWLSDEFSQKGFEVISPNLPNAKTPRREEWLSVLRDVVGTPDENTYFVGHSLGCAAVLRYINLFPAEVIVGGAIFVGGSLRERDEVEDDPERLLRYLEWNPKPLDFEKLRTQIPKIFCLFSDNDYFVPLMHADRFKEKLGAEVLVVEDRGHFSFIRDSVTEIPEVLETLERWTE